MATQLSRRGDANVSNIMPRIPKTVLEAGWAPNEDSVIDLSMAENWLIRDEILEIQKTVATDYLNHEVNADCRSECADTDQNSTQHLSFPKGFWGDPELLRTLSEYFNQFFNPQTPVLPSHFALAPGAAGCIDAVLLNLCDPDDGVLVPAPYWSNALDPHHPVHRLMIMRAVFGGVASAPQFPGRNIAIIINARQKAYRFAMQG